MREESSLFELAITIGRLDNPWLVDLFYERVLAVLKELNTYAGRSLTREDLRSRLSDFRALGEARNFAEDILEQQRQIVMFSVKREQHMANRIIRYRRTHPRAPIDVVYIGKFHVYSLNKHLRRYDRSSRAAE